MPISASYPYVAPEPCWIANGDHHLTREAAAATGHPVDQADQRCVCAECASCSAFVDLVAAHCSSWAEARAAVLGAGWYLEDHRRLIWCPSCYPSRPTGPPPPDCPLDPDQLALTDYVS